MDSLVGKTINGRYQIVEHLGRGGMAEVYKAYQASLERYVAIKLMHSFLADDPEFYNRFSREARSVATLRHPNIIQIHDFDREGDTSYMVMEFVDGGALKDRLEALAAKGEALPLGEAIRIIKDVGAALAYAHKRGMIHRDIKPANVMLDSSGRVILTDFGIAKILSGAKFTASGAVMGTPSYMAPEQGLGQPGDARSDIYSLGVMFYQLVTGQLPFDADTPVAVILKHVNEPITPPVVINANLPAGVQNIILKAMAKSPGERYQSVDDMLADLSDLKAAESIKLPVITSVAPGSDSATVRSALDTRAGSTVIGKQGQNESGATTGKKASIPILAIVIGVVLVLAIGTAAVFGGSLFRASAQPTETLAPTTPAPSNTPAPTESPTDNPLILSATEQAATLSALQTRTAPTFTPEPSATPNLTATFQACVFDAALSRQDPTDGSNIPVSNKEFIITLEFENKGNCAWGENTSFTYDSGDTIHNPDIATLSVPAAQPGEKVAITFGLKISQPKAVSETWRLEIEGRQTIIVVLKYKGVVLPTLAPRFTPTFTLAPTSAVQPTATSATGTAITGASPTFFSCAYVQNTTDYECLTTIGVGGGAPPFTISIDGLAEMTGVQTPNSPFFFKLRGRRCIDRIFSFRIVDSIGQVFDGNGVFQPLNMKLFNNNTEICGLG